MKAIYKNTLSLNIVNKAFQLYKIPTPLATNVNVPSRHLPVQS